MSFEAADNNPSPRPCRRQPGGALHDEDEKEDPTTGGLRDKNWLSKKIGVAFGAVGNPSDATVAAGASALDSAENALKIIKQHQHHQKKMSSALFDKEATMGLPSKQK